MRKLHALDLFSGIGGIGLALNEWVRTIAYCEQDRYAQGVLLSRMQSGDIDRAPIFDDVCKLRGEHFITKPEIIFGGSPCQDLSVAGLGNGLSGERSGLFFEIIRLTSEIRPQFVFLENAPAILVRGLDRVLLEFTKIGYDCRWTTLSASSIGANHKRDRWFLLANANNGRQRINVQQVSELRSSEQTDARSNGEIQYMAYSDGGRFCTGDKKKRSISVTNENGSRTSWWEVEPDVGRVVDELPHRVDRIKCLGNSVVPVQVKTAFEKLIGLEH